MFKIINNLFKFNNNSSIDLWKQSPILRNYYKGPKTTSSSSFTPREFISQTSDGESGTLITRFAKYISINKLCNLNISDNKPIKYAEYFPPQHQNSFRQEITKIETDQLPKLIVYSALYRCRSQAYDFVEVLNSIDKECTKRLEHEVEFNDIIKILAAFMYVIPNKMLKLHFYQTAAPKLLEEFVKNPNPDDFIKMVFYLGLFKRNKTGTEYMKAALDEYLDTYLGQEITTMDFAILCNSAFKTSVKLNNPAFNNRIIEEMCKFKSTKIVDISLLITYVKSVRLNRIRSARITETLLSLIRNGQLNELEFKGYTHIFAYFADNHINDPEVIEFLVKKCMKTIYKQQQLMVRNNDEFQEVNAEVRPKDISAFIWACSHLNVKISEDQSFKAIADILFYKVSNQEYRYCFDELVDTVLSLWVLNYKSSDLINVIFGNREFNKFNNPDRPKIESRKKLLMTCVEIENPKEFSNRSASKNSLIAEESIAPNYLVKNRQSLIEVSDILSSMTERFSIKSVTFVNQIQNLNIAGIFVKFLDQREGIHLEVLDTSNSLSDSVTPIGLFNMKLRLLDTQNCNYALVNTNNVTRANLEKSVEQEIEAFLEKQSEQIVVAGK